MNDSNSNDEALLLHRSSEHNVDFEAMLAQQAEYASQLHADNMRLTQQITEMEQSIHELEAERDQLNEANDQSIRSEDKLRDGIRLLEKSCKTIMQRKDKIKQENSELQAQVRKLKALLKENNNQQEMFSDREKIDRAEKENDRLKEELLQARNLQMELTAEKDAQIHELQAQLERRNNHIQEQNKVIDQLHLKIKRPRDDVLFDQSFILQEEKNEEPVELSAEVTQVMSAVYQSFKNQARKIKN